MKNQSNPESQTIAIAINSIKLSLAIIHDCILQLEESVSPIMDDKDKEIAKLKRHLEIYKQHILANGGTELKLF